MCGIFFSISTNRSVEPSAELLSLLQHRGPDSTQTLSRVVGTKSIDGHAHSIHLTFVSTVLALRGEQVVRQPYSQSDSSSTLCWNGEAWAINGRHPDGNDTTHVFDTLAGRRNDEPLTVESLVERMSSIAGPYAFVYYDAASQTIYFGRDFLGRRSLVWSSNEDGDFILSSVSAGEACQEIEADGVYSLDLSLMMTWDGRARRSLEDLPLKQHPFPTIDQQGSQPTTVIPRLALSANDLGNKLVPLDRDSSCVTDLHQHLLQSLTPRVINIPHINVVPNDDSPSSPARLAVLFSGGLDCALLARISHDLIPTDQPIDLLNVAFENPRVHKNSPHVNGSSAPYELCPDRITGRASFADLCEVCPNRLWRFVAIDVPYTDTTAHRDRVLTLMHPHNTEMDLSISYALYFASRGIGRAYIADGSEPQEYTTPARVLLSGLGADELFAGYTRHATAYRRNGAQGLVEELSLDIGRLGKRNLGRDDRVISHWGKEVRFPYLDESFVHWALNLPFQDKCGFFELESTTSTVTESQQLEPGKKILRCLAWKLGMPGVAKEKKRAIQFGARTAKMETGKTKGTTLVS